MTQTPAAPAAVGISQQSVSEAVRSQFEAIEERRKTQETIDRLTRERDDAKAVAGKLQEQLDSLKAADERRAKSAKIIEQAKTLGAGEISSDYAMTLAKLEEAEVTATLKERAELLARAGGAAPPSQQAPNFNAPSVGSQQHQEPSVFGWLK